MQRGTSFGSVLRRSPASIPKPPEPLPLPSHAKGASVLMLFPSEMDCATIVHQLSSEAPARRNWVVRMLRSVRVADPVLSAV